MKRKIIKYLQDWKAQKDRKPLIVNGARQVGKTFPCANSVRVMPLS